MFDLAVIGSGFAGSLIAMIARRLGLSVVLIERGKHPRFAIGESSTPLTNLLLEELATRYNLPNLLPFTKWGAWQHATPQIACGLKRGFSFFHHQLGEAWRNDEKRDNQLLVAASPNDWIADTHWYRAEFDEYFARAAAELGVTLLEEVELHRFTCNADSALLEGTRHGQLEGFHARFVIDATGPRGFVHRALSLPEATLPHLPPTEALYAHFTGVEHLEDTVGGSDFRAAPYSIDHAAVHHVFDGGWIWILRFNNGVTSAGVAATAERARAWRFEQGEAAWKQVLADLPTVGGLFIDARAIIPFCHSSKLAFRSGCSAGKLWTQLPSASGFVDPLLSTGFPLTLLGVARLAEALEQDWNTPRFPNRIREIARENESDFLAAEHLVAALYAQMHDFPVFRALTLLYFAAASFSEAARRLQRAELQQGFLLHRHPHFGKALGELCSRAVAGIPASQGSRFIDEVTATIEPINIAGLGRINRNHWYPADLEDLVKNSAKLGASRAEVTAMIQRTLSKGARLPMTLG